jgi:predicted aldo/keto reductase-like oxidoreductase
MDAYNQKLLDKKPNDGMIIGRLSWHWHVPQEKAAECIQCGLCEGACTQHINIIERLREIAAIQPPKAS